MYGMPFEYGFQYTAYLYEECHLNVHPCLRSVLTSYALQDTRAELQQNFCHKALTSIEKSSRTQHRMYLPSTTGNRRTFLSSPLPFRARHLYVLIQSNMISYMALPCVPDRLESHYKESLSGFEPVPSILRSITVDLGNTVWTDLENISPQWNSKFCCIKNQNFTKIQSRPKML